ncbi:MAG: DUF2147 domain-containing protein [Paracoccaceae bacterium]|uniref:DUF2147 domain-containing protein n=1 Tax=Seohaeicola saemankumensis TaxID=481181 RepID=UPI001E4F2535|nr:DUF2147 domain-containing protein [Seohaeicola saemankumensis]MCD1626497.1 DUF2147 domain-containing protein [Seohaeicola saemankumensis]
MRKTGLLVVGMIMAAGGAMAEPLLGTWRTAPDDNGNTGLIQVAPCGQQICGTLVKSFDGAGTEIASANNGKMIISETVSAGGGAYKGKVWAPDRNKTYNSRLELSGNTLKVSGCVMGICREGGNWSRVK